MIGISANKKGSIENWKILENLLIHSLKKEQKGET